MAKKKEINLQANLLKRFFAFVIDLLVIYFVIGFPFLSLLEKAAPKNPFDTLKYSNPLFIKIGMILSLIALLYFAILEYRIGQTVGKIFFNLKVESELDQNEKRFWQYLFRSMYFIPIIPFSFFWFIDPIYIAFHPEHKRFSEVISKTKTIEVVVLKR